MCCIFSPPVRWRTRYLLYTKIQVSEVEPDKMYKQFFMEQITHYQERYYEKWYCNCYTCKPILQSLVKADYNPWQLHPNFKFHISYFLDESVNRLPDEECKTLLNHGIVTRLRLFPFFLFCLSCQCELPSIDHHLDAHLKGKRHQKSIQAIAKDSAKKAQNLNNNINKKQSNISVITEASMKKNFCLSCQLKLRSSSHFEKHLKGKRHKKSIQAVDSTKKTQNLSKNINEGRNNTSVTLETSMKFANKSKSSAKIPVTGLPYCFMQMAKQIIKSYSPMQEAELYKHFVMKGITHYNGQWYCYVCHQSLKEVGHHLQNFHPFINTQMTNFLNKSVKLYLQNCKELLNHGIVIRNEQQDWFCLPCQCSVPLNPFDMHLKGKNHQKCIKTIAKDSTKKSQNLNDSINKKQGNATAAIETLTKLTKKPTKISVCITKSVKDLPKASHPLLATKLKLTTKSKSSEKVSVSTAELVKGLPDVSYSLMLETNMYKHFLKQRITRYNGQWYCDWCKSTLQSLAEVERHLQEIHTNVNIKVSNFLDKSNLTNEECEKLLNHGIVVRDVPQNYFCLSCQRLIPSLVNSDLHLKGRKHQKYMKTIAADFANDQEKSNDNTNGKQSNLSTNVGMQLKHTVESKFLVITSSFDNFVKNILDEYNIKEKGTVSSETCEIDRNKEKYSTEKNYAVTQTLQKLLKSKDIDAIVDDLFKLSNYILHDPKSIQLMDALRSTFETRHFPLEVCMFGSRFTGLALPNSDIDIYLDFGDECTEAELIKSRSKQIEECLQSDEENWKIKTSLPISRTPIIKVKHRLTGLDCDVSFTSPLSLEKSKFIKSFNMAYPSCKKMILFLKVWLSLGKLSGSSGITNYTLTWLVIFYLQVKYKIPSIAALIKLHNQSKMVSDWKIGVGDIVPIKLPKLEMRELLKGFFIYYANFDYTHLIVCPLLGDTCHKESLTRVSDLPSAMAPYIAQLRSAKPEYLCVDSAMCVQDPFDLSHNLTKAVHNSTLERFKQCCDESCKALILHKSKN